ncbi:alpha-ketoglutarate-dependent dioxygenase AlkB [Rhizobium halophytocola]|uniref:Alkylated DNA repair dioxygenase AlkB n=1 Tax=Rhizobium halophytocola TaxID=735519 RepID=A0ABS4E557_9HYPH|nr:alpha-ketoglutarate-dependent dioxygenase AlkB [Rhizobium halophytocola]MBP1853085.1 alkylated DNA repair dioxygenase AlkB [Rhizobium halophytocola]
MDEVLSSVVAPALPPGASYLPEMLSVDDERHLVEQLDQMPWSRDLKRRVQHFGYRYDYRARSIAEAAHLGLLPDWLQSLAARLVADGLFETLPDQVIANEYRPGQGIGAHVDCIPCFDDTIVSISLLSACEMVFRDLQGPARTALILRPRSALVLKGEARYRWTHAIAPRKSDPIDGGRVLRKRRVSLTFRHVLKPA